jgi:hypothetical protein
MANNMQFAVIPLVEEVPAAALFPPQSVISFQGKEDTSPDTTDSQHGLKLAGVDIDVDRCHDCF